MGTFADDAVSIELDEQSLPTTADGPESDLEELLALIPRDGSTITNKNLRDQLDWDKKRYWDVRNELVAEGEILSPNPPKCLW